MNSKEFKERYMPHYKLLYRVAYRLEGNPQDAEDLLQDMYLKLWRQRDRLPENSIKTNYLITIIQNMYRDRHRVNRLNMSAEIHDDIKIDPTNGIDVQVEQKEDAERMNHLINLLPEKERKIAQMCMVDGMSYEDIGNTTGLSNGNIRIIIMRIRNKLKYQFFKLTGTWKN